MTDTVHEQQLLVTVKLLKDNANKHNLFAIRDYFERS